MFSEAMVALADDVLTRGRAAGIMIATAESCTGGLVSACLTAVPGASDVFDRGFVTYTNEAKIELLGVPPALIEAEGAVSEAVARTMADGALARSRAGASVAITGVAGPGGGSDAKPVGLVWIAGARNGRETIAEKHLFGDIGRANIQEKSLLEALLALKRLI